MAISYIAADQHVIIQNVASPCRHILVPTDFSLLICSYWFFPVDLSLMIFPIDFFFTFNVKMTEHQWY